MARADLNAYFEKTVAEAEEKRGDPIQASDASRTKGIQDNRAKEKQANRNAEVFRLGQSHTPTNQRSADVLEFPGFKSQEKPDYSLPSIEEILGEDDE